MDIVRFKGGLGNQMFQYALVEALRAYGREVRCSLGFYKKHPDVMHFCLKDIFSQVNLNEIEEDMFNEIDLKWKKIKEDKGQLIDLKNDILNRFFWVEEFEETYQYIENIFNTKNCTFVGYWQTEKYFKNIEARIREVYTFKILNEELGQLAKQLSNNYYGVHIRRGDYLNYDFFQGICTKEYYINAIEYIRMQNKNARVIFFSDDIEWAYQNLYMEDSIYDIKNKLVDYQDWYDMYLMSQCCGNIIANSSFSWWGAWLNQNPKKIVIAPKKWMSTHSTPDIWCDDWIKL